MLDIDDVDEELQRGFGLSINALGVATDGTRRARGMSEWWPRCHWIVVAP